MGFVNDILGFIPQSDWLDVGFNVTRPNDPIDGLFGDERTDNLTATWQSIAAEYQVPMMAQFHAFDTIAQKTFRVPVDTHYIEKGLIKVKLNQSERMRALLRTGVRQDALYDYVLNDGIRLADQVVTRSKVAKNELMATGKVTIKENNLDLTVDYGLQDEQVDGISIDLNPAADVFSQLQNVVDAAAAAGVTLNGMMTSRATLSALRRHPSVQTAINGTASVGAYVRANDLESFLASEFGITQVITNDLSYGSSADLTGERPAIHSYRYYPADKITFFATTNNGKLGVGLWGDPPEVDVSSLMQVNQSGVSPYVYVSQWTENDPAVLWTKASALFMPVLYNPSSLWIANVVNTGE